MSGVMGGRMEASGGEPERSAPAQRTVARRPGRRAGAPAQGDGAAAAVGVVTCSGLTVDGRWGHCKPSLQTGAS